MALINKVDTDFTRTDIPVLRADDRLTAGSLVLFDAAHAAGGLGTGVPANAAVIPNIAASIAAGLTGGDLADMAGAFDADYDSTEGAFERTRVGGLHGAWKQNGAPRDSKYARLAFPAEVVDYVAAAPTRRYLFSVWGRLTRAANASGYFPRIASSITKGPGESSNYLHLFDVDANRGTNAASRLSIGANATTGPFFRAAVTTAPNGTLATDALGGRGTAATWGAFNSYATVGASLLPSMIFYSCHFIDLDAAGVDTTIAMQNEYGAFLRAFGPGGRYADDAFTAPATLAGA